MLERALKRIPTGSQTFSKSYVQFPRNLSPLFLSHGKDGHVWDVDGNEYVDLICGLLPILLGYQDRDVDNAIKAQLERGIVFSLASELEVELAERLASIIPCAEMSRFGKNGSDATTAAVRLARAATGRDRVVICGYHGWHDWYVGTTTRARGVPQAARELTTRIPYGDLEAFHKVLTSYPGEIAGIIMEPMNVVAPPDGYLANMREMAHAHGALFMFDEVITGFRYAAGGAQELFGVTPDIAAFGKGLGNGMPIAALVGQEKYMRLLDEVFVSGTFGGEALSLAAAIAVVDKIEREPVIEHLWKQGARLAEAVTAQIKANGLEHVIKVTGQPCWSILAVEDHPAADAAAIKSYLVTRGFQHGVLANGSHNICYAHDDKDIDLCIAAYGSMLAELAELLRSKRLLAELGCEPVYPVFSVRSIPRSQPNKV
jgi:glutamate-1-semialdehyde 2,1-aminomutase/spore coat polysaccharide biosynthesis protein SpsF